MDNQGPNEAPITELFVLISTDERGNDGICAATIGGRELAMVTSRSRIAETLRPIAEELAKASGYKITLIRLAGRTDLWTVE